MDSHNHIVSTAISKVDCRLTPAHYRVIEHYEKKRAARYSDDKRRNDEPHALATSMSPVALHDWRLMMKAHERRLGKAKPTVSSRLHPHAIEVRAQRDRRAASLLSLVGPWVVLLQERCDAAKIGL